MITRRIGKIFGIIAAAVLMLILILAPVAAASPPQPTYGTATVDGDPSEWDLTNDFFADMYRAGKPNFPVESKLYLRHDCSTRTFYVLVLAVDGVLIDTTTAEESFVIVNGSKLVDDESPPPLGSVFHWVGQSGGTALGWEASGFLSTGSYTLRVHTNVIDDGTQTSDVADRAIDLLIKCYAPPQTVGGEVYPVDKLAILAPWIALAAFIIAGTAMAMRYRRTRS